MPPFPRRRRGGLLTPLRPVAKAAGKALWRKLMDDYDFRHQRAEGVIDFRARRYAIDYDAYARLYADGKEWDGRSGRRLATLPPTEQPAPAPLWLVDVLTGVTAATEAGDETVRGANCRRFEATVDIGRASDAMPGGVSVPSVQRFEELLALPLEVWLDDTHVRRVRYAGDLRTETIELWDFGVALDDLDWTRLPGGD